MPSVKYSFTLSNAEGYEGLEEELKLVAEMDIPDGYDDKELKDIISEIQTELPYVHYENVIVEVIEVQVQEKSVRSFEVKGDNIGNNQKNYIKRVYQKIEADVMMKRSKTALNNPEEKIRFEKVFDGVKNTLSNLLEMFFGWLNSLHAQTNQRKERLRKKRMEKQSLEEQKEKRKYEKTFIEAELLIEREIILEQEKIRRIKTEERRIKTEERMEKKKLARLKKEADTQKLKTKNKELETQKKELETQVKELKTQIDGYKAERKQSKANTNAVLEQLEHLKATINLQQDGGIENGGFER